MAKPCRKSGKPVAVRPSRGAADSPAQSRTVSWGRINQVAAAGRSHGATHRDRGGRGLDPTQLRGRAATLRLPIIFLTARDSDLDVISGLRLGADDYLTKDISIQHLVARVVALFRRVEALSGGTRDEQLLERGPLKFSVERMEVSWKDTAVPLTVTEFWILHSLIRHPGHVRTRAQLMDDASVLVDDQTITSHIKRIRRKFVAVDPSFDQLDTVYGAGYRWKPAGSNGGAHGAA
jgi:two-component system OmpR family response regulator